MIKISPDRYLQISDQFKNKKILVLGDLMIDEYLSGPVARLSPEAPVPVIEVEEESLRFGGAANVALNIKALGCEPLLIGIVGKDRMADRFRELLSEQHMTDRGILAVSDRPTTVKTRIIGQAQHIARVDREKRHYLQGKQCDDLLEKVGEQMDSAEAVILQDYNKGVLPPEVITAVIAMANKKGIKITVDPKFLNFTAFKGVSLFKPNIKETEAALTLDLYNEEELHKAGNLLLNEMRTESVLITRGALGMTLFEKSGDVSHVPTRARKVADVSGAGDTVISTLTAALVGGADYKEAAHLANNAAGIVCEEVGIIPVDPQKLQKVTLTQYAELG